MESVSKLKDADEKYKRIILTHDIITEDREEYKRLVAETKEKQKEEISGEFLFLCSLTHCYHPKNNKNYKT